MSGGQRAGTRPPLQATTSLTASEASPRGRSSPTGNDRSTTAPSPGWQPRRQDPNAPLYVRDVMTLNVVTVSAGSTLADAVDLLLQHHISGVPVVQDTAIVGILSEKDIARRVLSEVGLSQLPYHLLALIREFSSEQAGHTLLRIRQVLRSTSVRQAMVHPPIVVAPDASVDEAAQTMIRRKVHRLPVVEHGRLVGIVTREDITRVSAGILAGEFD